MSAIILSFVVCLDVNDVLLLVFIEFSEFGRRLFCDCDSVSDSVSVSSKLIESVPLWNIDLNHFLYKIYHISVINVINDSLRKKKLYLRLR